MISLLLAFVASLSGAGQLLQTINVESSLLQMKMKDINDDEYEYTKSTLHPEATFIDNAFYFDNNTANYASNNEGICGLVAAQIILNYYDTFQNDNLIDEQYDTYSISQIVQTSLSGWNVSPGSGTNILYQNDTAFIDILTDVANNSFLIGGIDIGLTAGDVRTILSNYTSSRNLSYVATELPMTFASFCSFIEDRVNNNEPVICAVPEHFVVVYGYDDDYFYFDTGYKYSARAPRNLFNFHGFSLCVRYEFTAPHIHSDNYYNNPLKSFYCGCGESHHKMLYMQNSDWEFESQYYFYNKNKQHTKNGLSFSSSRQRTGYIEETAINLSPRRANAGIARFDIILPYYIKQFSVEMAWWSASEHQNDGTAYIMTREYGMWHLEYANILNEGLPLSKNLLSQRTYILNPETDAIRFYLTNNAVGDRNLGRLSIGDIKIEYCLD